MSTTQTDATKSPSLGINLPNKLTILRLVLTPVFVVLLSFDSFLFIFVATLVAIVASISDYLDGHIARSRNLVTNFGKLFDPVADKVFFTAALVMIMLLDDLYIPGWTVVAILSREFLVTGARSLAATEGMVIAANSWGKAKTVVQTIFMYCCLGFVLLKYVVEYVLPEYVPYYVVFLRWGSFSAAILVALVTIYSGVQFALMNWRALKLDQLA